MAEGDLTDADRRDRLAANLRLDALASMNQVHGAGVVWADPTTTPEADAQLTDQPGLGLLVKTADCVPIALAGDGVIGVVHAGRRGLIAGVVPAAVAAIRERSDGPITAWVGPHICGFCYALDPASAHDVADAVPEARSTTRDGLTAANLGKGVLAQLSELGVRGIRLGGCTYEDDRFYCHRQNADPRRQGVVMVMR